MVYDFATIWIQFGYDLDTILIRFRYHFDTILIGFRFVSSLLQDWFSCVCYVFDIVFGLAAELLSQLCFPA